LLDLALRGFAPIWLKNWFARRLNNYEMHELAAMSEPVSNVDIVSGCYMLLRSDAFKAVNGFDERFFLYFEDFDLSLRIRSEGEVVYLPSMEIAHYGGSAAKKGFTHITLFAQSAWKFYQRHGWRWI
jgi:GT2 family glycosyltransferase